MKIRCLIDHADVVFKGMILEVIEKNASQVCVTGLDNYPLWLSENYNGVKEFEVVDYNLLLCPFCGSQANMKTDECIYGVGPTYYYVECSHCYVRTHSHSDVDETLWVWNERVE